MSFLKRMQKSFVSEADLFMASIRKQLPLSKSQAKEIEKHQRIFKARDEK